MADQWQFLVQKSAEKSQKLKEANKQQNFNTGIKDFDFWLSEVTPRGFPSCHQRTSSQTFGIIGQSTSLKPGKVKALGVPLIRNLHITCEL